MDHITFNHSSNSHYCKELLLEKSKRTNKYIYDKILLQKSYFHENQNNIHRTIPLKIVHMKPDNKQILPCLQDWKMICEHKLKLYDPQNDIYKRLITTSGIITTVQDDLENYNTGFGLKKSDRITAIVDDAGKMQAICVSSDDQRNSTAWKINSLVSSPLNLRDNDKHYVEGAATALIQDVIEQVLIKQNLNPETKLEFTEGQVAVTLNALSDSIDFYKHIGFVEYVDPIKNMILKDHKLVEFLQKYGGRYINE